MKGQVIEMVSHKKKQDLQLITNKLARAGIKVQSGKKAPKNDEFPGILGNSKKVIELKI
jgi:hypothetical protein